jgi:hypothetical protein
MRTAAAVIEYFGSEWAGAAAGAAKAAETGGTAGDE